jgi:hypothetical protein
MLSLKAVLIAVGVSLVLVAVVVAGRHWRSPAPVEAPNTKSVVAPTIDRGTPLAAEATVLAELRKDPEWANAAVKGTPKIEGDLASMTVTTESKTCEVTAAKSGDKQGTTGWQMNSVSCTTN